MGHYNVGCPTTPPPTPAPPPPQSTTSPCPFDCNAGYQDLGPLQWVKGWSGAKNFIAAGLFTGDAPINCHRRPVSQMMAARLRLTPSNTIATPATTRATIA